MKWYLGDGAYAEWDGWSITLTTENGLSVTNTVVLGPLEYEALITFVQRLGEEPEPERDPADERGSMRSYSLGEIARFNAGHPR